MPKFYEHVDKFSFRALTGAAAGFVVVSSVTGIMYAEVSWFFPLVAIPIICVFWSLITAVGVFKVIRATKARHRNAVGILAFLGGLVGYYVHWCVWLALAIKTTWVGADGLAFLKSASRVGTAARLFLNPTETLDLVFEIRKEGLRALWFGEGVPRGFLLTCCWSAEFLIYVCHTGKLSRAMAELPFCEAGNGWYRIVSVKRNKFKVPESWGDEILPLFEAATKIRLGMMDYFLETPFVTDENEDSFILDLLVFPSSRVAYATVWASLKGCGRKGDNERKFIVAKNLEVSRELADSILERMRR
ncbi:MAG: hypothetical protein LBF41_05590 [Deltaproteobacteria bacterium]|nr:hypothetical protein [Deltaproteobacteria bacterium]